MTFRSRGPGLVIVASALGAAVLGVLGGPLIPAWVVMLFATSLLIARKLPASLSVSLSVVGFLAIELVLLRLTPYLGLGIAIPNIVLWSVMSLGVGVVELHRPHVATLFSWRRIWLALAASVSAIAAVGVFSLAQLVQGTAGLYWSMNNDAIIGLGFARDMVTEGGLGATMGAQSTPLPFAMAAANMDSGRFGLADSMLRTHDLTRVAQVWELLIAIGCVLAGIIIARRVTTARLAWAIPVVTLGSSVMLSWYVIGVQIDFGFMNSAFAIAALLASWLIFDSARDHPLAGLAGLFLAALVMLGVWSPLIVCMIGLGAVVIFSSAHKLGQLRGAEFIAAVVAGVLLIAYAFGVTLPQLLRASSALGNDGGFPPIGQGSALVITSLTILVAALAMTGGSRRASLGTFAVVGTFLAGLIYLLAQRRGTAFIWGYYPAKFAWTVSILLIVIVVSLSTRLIATANLGRGRRLGLTIALGAVVASLLYGPIAATDQAPLVSILRSALVANSPR